MKDYLYAITKIKRSELTGALVSFVFIFLLMASYMILKPVRDAMAPDYSQDELLKLWTGTFIASSIAVFIYNILTARVSVRRLVPGVFLFFALSFVATAIALKVGVDQLLLGKFFYMWVSVFALFNISVFWSFATQNYSREQSKRMFAFINVGASLGAFAGPFLVVYVVRDLPLELILLLTGGSLLTVIPLIIFLNRYFGKRASPSSKAKEELTLSANPFSGFKEFFKHKRLMGIGAFIFIFVGIGTFFYLAQTEILSEYSMSERKVILGK